MLRFFSSSPESESEADRWVALRAPAELARLLTVERGMSSDMLKLSDLDLVVPRGTKPEFLGDRALGTFIGIATAVEGRSENPF